MSGHLILLNLFGGIALLLWGTQMVQTGLLRNFGVELRAAMGRIAGRPVLAAATGTLTAAVLQSATATAMLLTTFVARKMVALSEALALMLGADLGTTLVVQALSFKLTAATPVLLIVGVALARLSEGRLRQTGRILLGFGLIFLALGMIVAASEPLRASPSTALILGWLSSDPILVIVVAALMTWLMHSSVAFVLFVISLTGAGLVDLPLALLLVLGANLGAGLIPIGLALKSPISARQVLWGNLAFRAIGVLLVLIFAGQLTQAITVFGSSAPRLAAHFHTLFNLGLVVVFLPLTGLAAQYLETIFPANGTDNGPQRLAHLDPSLHDRPALALNAATRALLQLADKVELMLREAIQTFENRDDRKIQYVAALEDEVDAEQEEIKLYLARQMQNRLDKAQSAQVLELVLFTTNLEHIGDIIDKGLLRLAAKKQKKGLQFSPAGWSDIQAFHGVIAEQMRLAMTVFVSRDVEMARDLVAKKDWLRGEEIAATERHFQRLRDGLPETIETSALHLDLLRDLKRINAHLTTVAYPVLESTGELRASRLNNQPVVQPISKAGRKRGAAVKAG